MPYILLFSRYILIQSTLKEIFRGSLVLLYGFSFIVFRLLIKYTVSKTIWVVGWARLRQQACIL